MKYEVQREDEWGECRIMHVTDSNGRRVLGFSIESLPPKQEEWLGTLLCERLQAMEDRIKKETTEALQSQLRALLGN